MSTLLHNHSRNLNFLLKIVPIILRKLKISTRKRHIYSQPLSCIHILFETSSKLLRSNKIKSQIFFFSFTIISSDSIISIAITHIILWQFEGKICLVNGSSPLGTNYIPVQFLPSPASKAHNRIIYYIRNTILMISINSRIRISDFKLKHILFSAYLKLISLNHRR